MKKRIGIYSGTFDPVHNGHVGFALNALETLELDQVVFIPEKSPRGKVKESVTDLAHRFELLVRAVAPYEALSVRLLSAEQFCVLGTLPELRSMFGDSELYLLIGSDVVATFDHRWNNLDQVFQNFRLVIGLRAGDTKRHVKQLLKALDVGVRPKYVCIESPIAAASSTRVRSGITVRDIAPQVSSYIQKHQLYKGGK